MNLAVRHLDQLLDDAFEKRFQDGRIRQAGICAYGPPQVAALPRGRPHKGVEQQRQPILGKLPQHSSVPAYAVCLSAA